MLTPVQVVRSILRPLALRLGYDTRHWARVAMWIECSRFIEQLNPTSLDVLEISPGEADTWQRFPFRSYESVDFPDFDICRDRLDHTFDLIIADNVFEHLLHPHRAAENVYAMVKPGGHFVIMTPFLIPVHEIPIDCTRWTETGLRHLLADAGFVLGNIQTGSWGSRASLAANNRTYVASGYKDFAMRGFNSLKSEPHFPLVVWAFAMKDNAPQA